MKLRAEWYEQLRDCLLSLYAGLSNWNVGSRIRSLFEAVATGLEEISFQVDSYYRQCFVHTASTEGLELRGAELGLKRKPEWKARGWCRFYGNSGSSVPEGFRVATGDPDVVDDVVEFLTLAEGEIPDGETYIDLEVEAVVAGAAANVMVDTVTTMVDSAPLGIDSCTNPSTVSGGAAEETDEDFRLRCTLAPYRLSQGVERFWESLSTDIVGVARAKCASCWAGPGTFKVFLWSKDADDRLIAASETLITTVSTYLASWVPVGVRMTVAAPSGPLQDVLGYVEAAEGHTTEEVSPYVKAALTAVFTGLSDGDKLKRAALIAAAMGVSNVANFRLATPADDVEPGETDTLVPGLIQILPMEWDQDF